MTRIKISATHISSSSQNAARTFPHGAVLYYALGGGLGHFTRAAAIARQFRRLRNEPFLILTNRALLPPEPVDALQLEDRPTPPQLAELVKSLVEELCPAVFVTDAFPAGVLGELGEVLPKLPARRIAVVRRLQPQWIVHWRLPELLRDHYDAAALVEPGACFADWPESLRVVETAPTLIRDADELWTRARARQTLNCNDDTPLIAVVGEERDEWLAQAKQIAPQGAIRFISPATPENKGFSHYPLIELLPGCDFVVGACGYNLCHETMALNVPALLPPQPRLYDDQWARAKWRDERSTAPRSSTPRYENGAAQVAKLLAEMMD